MEGSVRFATENSGAQQRMVSVIHPSPLTRFLRVKKESGPHPDQAAFFSSRSARRRILPTLVLGSSERNSTYFGRL